MQRFGWEPLRCPSSATVRNTGGAALVVAQAAPALVPERLSTLDQLAAGWLLRFGPNTRDAYARDLRSWLTWLAGVAAPRSAARSGRQRR